MGSLDGKVVLVTGASSGLGEAAARLMAAEGASVVLAARRECQASASAIQCARRPAAAPSRL